MRKRSTLLINKFSSNTLFAYNKFSRWVNTELNYQQCQFDDESEALCNRPHSLSLPKDRLTLSSKVLPIIVSNPFQAFEFTNFLFLRTKLIRSGLLCGKFTSPLVNSSCSRKSSHLDFIYSDTNNIMTFVYSSVTLLNDWKILCSGPFSQNFLSLMFPFSAKSTICKRPVLCYEK